MPSRSYNRKTNIRSPDLFVIATEGISTEREYFKGVKSKLRDTRLKMHLLTRDATGESNPTQVITQVDDYKKNNRIGSRDLLCLVIDRDKQSTTAAQLSSVARQCRQKGYLLALSNPCFELWLLLHLNDLSEYTDNQLAEFLENRRQCMKKELQRKNDGYNYSNLQIDDFWAHTRLAIQRAKDLDDGNEWPADHLGTTVYKIIEKLDSLMPLDV